MPILVRVEGGETFGPYPESRIRKILAFARIGSSRGRPRRVEWTCGSGRPVLLRRYAEGQKTGPKNPPVDMKKIERVVRNSGRVCAGGGPRPSLGTMKLPKKSVPYSVRYKGEIYYRTGKYGTHIKTGKKSAEYANPKDARVWRRSDGVVEQD